MKCANKFLLKSHVAFDFYSRKFHLTVIFKVQNNQMKSQINVYVFVFNVFDNENDYITQHIHKCKQQILLTFHLIIIIN